VKSAAIAVILLAASLLACGSSGPSDRGAPGSPVEGIVIRVESSGLTDVQGFALRTNDGQTLEFRLGPLENGAQFPPGHLAEHQANSAPVRVFFRLEGADRVAFWIQDAG
jgi:hypothetical protein